MREKLLSNAKKTMCLPEDVFEEPALSGWDTLVLPAPGRTGMLPTPTCSSTPGMSGMSGTPYSQLSTADDDVDSLSDEFEIRVRLASQVIPQACEK